MAAVRLCHTKVAMKKCNYLWTIDNYRSVHEKRAIPIQSSTFSADNDQFRWCLYLNPSSRNYSGYSCVSLHLYPSQSSDISKYGPVSGKLECSILDAENTKKKSQNAEFIILNSSSTQDAGFQCFVEESYLSSEDNRVLPQDKLTIFCELSYIKKTDIINIEGPTFPDSYTKCEPTRLNGLETLFLSSEFSDVTLHIEGKNYPAHKNILAARSPVFKAMLTNDMKEKQTNHIEIKDMSKQVFTEMIRYIYTGQPQNLNTLSAELLAAADKYDLQDLKTMCEKDLYEKLSLETAVNTLMTAYMHHAENLKIQALQYIKIHSYNTNILDAEVRKVLVESCPDLLLEILDAFSKQNVS